MQLRQDYIMAKSVCQEAESRLPFAKTYAILFVSKEREVPPVAEQAKRPAVDRNSPEYQQSLYRSGRAVLIGVVILTVVNLGLLLFSSDTYLLCSVSVPYFLTVLGQIMDETRFTTSYTVTALVISVVVLALYVLCWALSKKHPGWLTAGLVLFCVDTVALVIFAFTLTGSTFSFFTDFAFHVLLIVELAMAVRANKKLKAMQASSPVTPEGYRGTTPDL